MQQTLLFFTAFSLTMFVGASLSPPQPIIAQPWLHENFDRLDFMMCRNYHGLDAKRLESIESSNYAGECGFKLLPNLQLPTKKVLIENLSQAWE